MLLPVLDVLDLGGGKEVRHLNFGQLGVEPGADLSGLAVKQWGLAQSSQADVDPILEELDQLLLGYDRRLTLLEHAINDAQLVLIHHGCHFVDLGT